jgi:hypothetical protein
MLGLEGGKDGETFSVYWSLIFWFVLLFHLLPHPKPQASFELPLNETQQHLSVMQLCQQQVYILHHIYSA